MTVFAGLTERSAALGVVRRGWSELRSNRRALVGLLLIFAIVVGEGLLLLRGAAQEARAAYGREFGRLQRVAAIEREPEWPQRAADSAVMRARFEERLWPAESDGIARADVQDWLTRVAREIGLSTLEVRIALATTSSLPPDLRQITATITAQPAEAALIALLDRIERAPHLLVVDRLNVRQQPAPFLELVLTAYARIGPQVGASPMTPAHPKPQ